MEVLLDRWFPQNLKQAVCETSATQREYIDIMQDIKFIVKQSCAQGGLLLYISRNCA